MSVRETANNIANNGAKPNIPNPNVGGVVPPTTPNVPNTPNPAGVTSKTAPITDRKEQAEAFRARGASIRKAMSKAEEADEGSLSNKVAFVITLGDPHQNDKRSIGKKEGSNKTQYEDCIKPVGYKFRALADIEVPSVTLKANANYSFEYEGVNWIPVKAGETFNLTLFEAGLLLSQLKFAGRINGGDGGEVVLHVTFTKNRIDAQGNMQPLVVLKRIGSAIKDNIEPIAVSNVDANGKKSFILKDEYKDKFAWCFKPKSISRSSGSVSKTKENIPANLAGALRDYYAKLGL